MAGSGYDEMIDGVQWMNHELMDGGNEMDAGRLVGWKALALDKLTVLTVETVDQMETHSTRNIASASSSLQQIPSRSVILLAC